MKKFDIPLIYRSDIVTKIKQQRRTEDPRRQNLSPSEIRFDNIVFKLARHFGFCYGVENAIETAYKAVRENPEKRIFLLSEMIHNPHVNEDLISHGVRFLMSTSGEQLIPFSELTPGDIVIVPAFGTTVQIFQELESIGIDLQMYNATCPFVEKVWKRSSQLGEKGYAVIIHGKATHEETRATFSHASQATPSLVILDIREAKILADFIVGKRNFKDFDTFFAGRYSAEFDPQKNLFRIGVVNQTTMLATETQEISQLLRAAMLERFGPEAIGDHFADTRDTLCYATFENQSAVRSLIESGGDLALVVGGYNSSNTSHLYELCERSVPSFYVKDANEIISDQEIRHWDWHNSRIITSYNWLPVLDRPVEVLITAGASCPDVLVEEVILKVKALSEGNPKLKNVS